MKLSRKKLTHTADEYKKAAIEMQNRRLKAAISYERMCEKYKCLLKKEKGDFLKVRENIFKYSGLSESQQEILADKVNYLKIEGCSRM